MNVAQQQVISPFLQQPILSVSLSSRGLFLVDMNELVTAARSDLMTAEAFMHETSERSAKEGTDASREPKGSQGTEKMSTDAHSNKVSNKVSDSTFKSTCHASPPATVEARMQVPQEIQLQQNNSTNSMKDQTFQRTFSRCHKP